MNITLAEQTQIFLYSCLLGAALSVFFDCFRILRIAVRSGTVLIAAEDILYFLASALVTYRFLLEFTMGQLRFYVILGIVLGWLLCHCTLGVLLLKVSAAIIGVVKRFLRLLYKIFIKPFEKFFRWIGSKIKKVEKRSKNCLKRKVGVVYNQVIIGRIRKRKENITDGGEEGKKSQEEVGAAD